MKKNDVYKLFMDSEVLKYKTQVKSRKKRSLRKIRKTPEPLIRDVRAMLHRSYKPKKAKISPNLIVFLPKIVGNELIKLIRTNAELFQDVLKVINAEFRVKEYHTKNAMGKDIFVGRCLTLQPLLTQPTGKDTIVFHHSVWGVSKLTEENRKYIHPVKVKWIEDGKEVGYYPFVMKRIYLPPAFVEKQAFYDERKEKWFANQAFTAIVGRDEIKSVLEGKEIKHPEPSKQASKGFVWELHKALFSEIDNSLTSLTVIPINLKDRHIVKMNPEDYSQLELNMKKQLIVFRDPIVSEGNIQVVRCEKDNKIPSGVIGISLEILKEMYGDTDGDTISVIGTKGIMNLKEKPVKDIKIIKPNISEFEKIEIPTGSEKEFLEKARIEHEKIVKSSYEIKHAGIATKSVFINAKREEELDYGYRNVSYIEGSLKDRPELELSERMKKNIYRNLMGVGTIGYVKKFKRKEPEIKLKYKMNGARLFTEFVLTDLFKGKRALKNIPSFGSMKYKALCSEISPFTKWIMLLVGAKNEV